MTDPSLPSDPDDFMALMTITVAMDRNKQVTQSLIVQTMMALLADGDQQQLKAASAMKLDRTKAAAIRFLEAANHRSLIGPDLLQATPARPPLKVHDRVRLTIPISSTGVSYPGGSAGIVVQPSDPDLVRQFAEAEEHPVLFDAGGMVAVPAVFLEKEDNQ